MAGESGLLSDWDAFRCVCCREPVDMSFVEVKSPTLPRDPYVVWKLDVMGVSRSVHYEM